MNWQTQLRYSNSSAVLNVTMAKQCQGFVFFQSTRCRSLPGPVGLALNFTKTKP